MGVARAKWPHRLRGGGGPPELRSRAECAGRSSPDSRLHAVHRAANLRHSRSPRCTYNRAQCEALPFRARMIGFDTIGNATLIGYDDKPVIATDPWIRGGAYFGSWSFSHAIPTEQLESIQKCPYLWFSHGHPDHLNLESISDLH